MSLHVFTAPWQPMTRYAVQFDDGVHWVECPAGRLYRCDRCRQRRRAVNLRIKVFYDMVIVQCVKDCKQPPRLPRAKVRR